MLKSSSLCLYSSNLDTFWLKMEQFWPFEEIYIFSNGDHLGYRTALKDTILKGDHLRPSWMEGIAIGYNFERDRPRDHSCQAWLNMVQRFQRRRFKCDLLSKYA